MAVIINEVEVIVERAPETSQGDPRAVTTPPPLRPIDFSDIIERQLQAALRLHAH
jgi:hypothetical protein